MRAPRIALLAVTSPLLTGAGFYAWLQCSPKSWADPACGFQRWELIASMPLIAAGALLPAAYAVRRGAAPRTIAATFVATVILTLGACFVAFLLWFGRHLCGE